MAKLARLDVADERIASLSAEMSAILDHMGAISAWDEAGVTTARPAAVRRTDTPLPTQEGLIEAAAEVDQHAVVVPPVKGAS